MWTSEKSKERSASGFCADPICTRQPRSGMIRMSSVPSNRLNETGLLHGGSFAMRFLYIVRILTACVWSRATMQECQFSYQYRWSQYM